MAFRFAFVYFGLFNLEVTLRFLPFPPFTQLLWLFNLARGSAVPWLGKNVLHLAHDFATDYLNPKEGSKDTTYYYVQALCYLLAAAIAALVWSLCDRKRTEYVWLHRWFLLYLRVSLAAAMISYGATKMFPYQFPPPLLSQLEDIYGNSSRSQLFWLVMGVSPFYSFFGGFMELVGGVLLMLPRLATLGALISTAVIGNVLMMNFGYDLAVKLLAIHLVLMGIVILLPDVTRLADFFLWNRNVAPAAARPLFTRRSLNLLAVALQIAFAILLLGYDVYRSHQLSSQLAAIRRAPLSGVWFVDEYQVNGESRPPLANNPHRWQRVIVNAKDQVVVQVMTGTQQFLYLRSDPRLKTFTLTEDGMPGWIAELTYDDSRPGFLVLSGKMGGLPVLIRLHREDEMKLSLNDHSVHWIHDAVK